MEQNNDIKFPVLLFEKNDSKMFGLNYKYLMGDIRFFNKKTGDYSAFKNIEIIDSSGKLFFIKEVKKVNGIKLWDSLKMMGLMIRLEPIMNNKAELISLEEVKKRIMRYVKKHSKAWLELDTISGIQKMVDNAKTHKELILIFK